MWSHAIDNYEVKRKTDFDSAKLIQKYFPDLGRGGDSGVSCNILAQRIIDSEKVKSFVELSRFSSLSYKTVAKYVRIALKGGYFKDEQLEGMLSKDLDEIDKQRLTSEKNVNHLAELNGYENWSTEEKEYLIRHYNRGRTRKRIFVNYSKNPDFTERTYGAVSGFFDSLIKKGEIKRQRIDWSGDVGFFAGALLARYGKEKNYAKNFAKSLDDYFYGGDGKIDRRLVREHFRRNNLI